MKQLKLGIIGAENSHSLRIAEMCNIKNVVPMRVTHLWGETDDLANACATKGKVPEIVSNWRNLAGAVDGIMIDHRQGKYHRRGAKYFIEKKILFL